MAAYGRICTKDQRLQVLAYIFLGVGMIGIHLENLGQGSRLLLHRLCDTQGGKCWLSAAFDRASPQAVGFSYVNFPTWSPLGGRFLQGHQPRELCCWIVNYLLILFCDEKKAKLNPMHSYFITDITQTMPSWLCCDEAHEMERRQSPAYLELVRIKLLHCIERISLHFLILKIPQCVRLFDIFVMHFGSSFSNFYCISHSSFLSGCTYIHSPFV